MYFGKIFNNDINIFICSCLIVRMYFKNLLECFKKYLAEVIQ